MSKYNGWTNYETWNVALWIDNEEGSHNYWREAAQECYEWAIDRGTGFTKEEQAVFDLADRLKSEFDEANPLASDASMWADLLNAAMSEVNWREIAARYIGEVDKTEEA